MASCCDSSLGFPADFYITSELQMIIHLLRTHDSTLRNQELKYSEEPCPRGEERWQQRSGPGSLASGRRVQSVGCEARPPRLLGTGDWHLLCGGEGPGSYWQRCHVHLHSLRSSSVATNTKKDLPSSVTSLGMEYLSLQMIALLPVLDTVLANMCNCWKCNDDYLHI